MRVKRSGLGRVVGRSVLVHQPSWVLRDNVKAARSAYAWLKRLLRRSTTTRVRQQKRTTDGFACVCTG